MKMEHTFTIPIDEWREYTSSSKFCSSVKSKDTFRRRFLAPFASILTQKLQDLGTF